MKVHVILSLFAVLGLTSCQKSQNEDLKGSIDRSSKPIVTTVYFHRNVDEVQQKYREIHRLSRDEKVNVVAFAKWPEYKDQNGNFVENHNEPLVCEIHTTRPKQVNDNETTTLGHEMLHCILGTYHSQETP